MKTIFAILLMCFTGFTFAQPLVEGDLSAENPDASGVEGADESEFESIPRGTEAYEIDNDQASD